MFVHFNKVREFAKNVREQKINHEFGKNVPEYK